LLHQQAQGVQESRLHRYEKQASRLRLRLQGKSRGQQMTSKEQVRKDFSYARMLMRKADEIMKDKSIVDFAESSEAGQIANELVASVATFSQWVSDQYEKGK
jgi:hypothetical protein